MGIRNFRLEADGEIAQKGALCGVISIPPNA
jgi:hypothetical protein